jgi:hypothetical protein
MCWRWDFEASRIAVRKCDAADIAFSSEVGTGSREENASKQAFALAEFEDCVADFVQTLFCARKLHRALIGAVAAAIG